MFRLFLLSVIALSLGCSSLLSRSSAEDSVSSVKVVDNFGVYPSPDGKCEASLEINEMGGFLTLSVSSKYNQGTIYEVDDITGMAWISASELVFTVSPIYGRPGIYLLNCNSRMI